MKINEYQELAMTTLNPELSKRDVLINSVMGLCGESGEAIDIVKKWMAQGHELDTDLSLLHDQHMVTHLIYYSQIMGNKKDGQIHFLLDFL